jgi:hypothetical protein
MKEVKSLIGIRNYEERVFDSLVSKFPSLSEIRNNNKVFFEFSLQSLRRSLLALSKENRFSMFEMAKKKMQASKKDFRNSGKYWIFSHPNVEIFEKFLADDELYKYFVNYLYMSGQVAEGGSSIKRRIKRYDPSQNVLKAFVKSYAKLISENINYLINKEAKHKATIFTGNIKEMSPQAIEDRNEKISKLWEDRVQKVIDQKLLEIHNARLAKSGTRNYQTYSIAKVFDVEPIGVKDAFTEKFDPTGEEEKYSILSALIELSCFDFETKVPLVYSEASQEAIMRKLFHSIRKGSYPIFQHTDEISLDIEFSSVGYKLGTVNVLFDETKLRELKSKYTDISEINKTDYLRFIERVRTVENGQLPIGIKIHCLKNAHPAKDYLQQGYFAAHNANSCFNLPPVGNVQVSIELLKKIEEKSGVKILNNPENYYVQICNPGRLNNENAGLLTIGFYLSSDVIRDFKQIDLNTTHHHLTASKIAIYDAGVQDNEFQYYGLNDSGELSILSTLPQEGRTDILWGITEQDIRNVNLISTLLFHSQFGGFFKEIGDEFKTEFKKILNKHYLGGSLETIWINKGGHKIGGEDVPQKPSYKYEQVMSDIQSYVMDEAKRIIKANEAGPAYQNEELSIFDDIAALMDYCKLEMESKLAETKK